MKTVRVVQMIVLTLFIVCNRGLALGHLDLVSFCIDIASLNTNRTQKIKKNTPPNK